MKTLIIIMSVFSILGLLFATFFGAWIKSNEGIVVDGTNLLEVHIVQGIGAVIITLATFGLIIFGTAGKKKIIMIIASFLCINGLALSCLSGWFVNEYHGLLATFARSVSAHRGQAITTAILTMIFLVFVILQERRATQERWVR